MENLNKIMIFSSSSTLARKFFEKLSLRKNNVHDSTVDSVLAWATKEVPCSRQQVVAMFKTLEVLGVARFIDGRRGKPSRLGWTVNAVELAKKVVLGTAPNSGVADEMKPKSEKSVESIQAFLTEKGIVSGIIPNSEGNSRLLTTIPFGSMWAELTATSETNGMLIVVALPIFPACAAANVENALISVNRGLSHGRFFVTEDTMGVLYTRKAEIDDRTFGHEEARELFETTHLEVSQNLVPIFLAAARWGEGPMGLAVAA